MADLIDRQAAIDETWKEPTYTDPLNVLTEVRDRIKALPPAQPDVPDTTFGNMISRQAAIDTVRSYYDECDEREESIEERIERLPSAEAEPVRHGHWINHPDDLFPEDSSIECSICHEWERILANDNFCPNCGARMDGKQDG